MLLFNTLLNKTDEEWASTIQVSEENGKVTSSMPMLPDDPAQPAYKAVYSDGCLAIYNHQSQKVAMTLADNTIQKGASFQGVPDVLILNVKDKLSDAVAKYSAGLAGVANNETGKEETENGKAYERYVILKDGEDPDEAVAAALMHEEQKEEPAEESAVASTESERKEESTEESTVASTEPEQKEEPAAEAAEVSETEEDEKEDAEDERSGAGTTAESSAVEMISDGTEEFNLLTTVSHFMDIVCKGDVHKYEVFRDIDNYDSVVICFESVVLQLTHTELGYGHSISMQKKWCANHIMDILYFDDTDVLIKSSSFKNIQKSFARTLIALFQ